MGIPCENTDFVYVNNKLVLTNTTVTASTLKNDMNSLSYHFFRQGFARDECRTAYVNTNFNLADLLTNHFLQGRNYGGL